MKIYHMQPEEGDGQFFSSKGAAVKEARLVYKRDNVVCAVVECELMPGKDGVVAMANGECKSQVKLFETKKKKKDV